MTEPRAQKPFVAPAWKRLASRSLLAAALLALILYLLFRILLATSWASDYLSHVLSRYFNEKVSVAKLDMSGATIILDSIVIESPAGFRNRKMISARSISLTPDIAGLLRGRRSLSSLEIIGLGLNAEKNSAGAWNFADLAQRLTKKKAKPSGEISIRRFSLQDASLLLNGHLIEKLGVTLADFSTKGTTTSRLALSGKDAAGNPLRLTAHGHLGGNPAFQVTLDAPAVALAPYQKQLPGNSPLHLEKARGKLALSADWRNRLLTVRATAACQDISLGIPAGSLPLNAHLDVEARYDSVSDSAELSRAVVTVDTILTVRARGTVKRVSRDSAFTLELTPERTSLGSLLTLLPESSRRGLTLSGEMSSAGFQLTGNRGNKISSAHGKLSLGSVALTREKQQIITGGAGDFTLSKAAQGWQVDGTIFSGKANGNSLIGSLSLPFSALFSQRFKPVQITAPAITAALAGIPIKGAFHYRPGAAVPLALRCAADDVPLSALNGFQASNPASTPFAAGKLTAAAMLTGISPQKFHGKISLEIHSAEAGAARSRVFLKNAAILANVEKSPGTYSVTGSVQASGGKLADKPFGARAGFFLHNRDAIFKDVDCTFGPSRIQARQLTARLPQQSAGQPIGQRAVYATLEGAEVSSGDLTASGISGRLEARYHAVKQEKKLTGTSELSFASLAFRNHSLASGTVHLNADGKNAQAEIKGRSLGGTLSARINTEVFSKAREASFSASLLQQQLQQLDGILPGKITPRISAGTADARLQGRFTHESGIEGTCAVAGQEIALRSAAGKSLVSGIAASFDATLRNGTLTLRKGLLSHLQGPSLRIEGAVDNFISRSRSGSLALTMPQTPINSLLDVFANALPRNLQEASCEGTCTLAGAVDFQAAATRINGELSLASASLEIPSQKVSVTGITGQLPFSLEFPGQRTAAEHPHLSYSRENYARLLEEQSRVPQSGKRLSINAIRFGAFETGTLSLSISASRGLMRFSPIDMNLYGGKLLGNGYLLLNGTPIYGADILLNDVSLKELCDSFPSIKGYISGRVDGILSLRNEQSGLKELKGYVNLWTRAGKGEEMLVSKEFLQKLAGKNLRGFFFQNDRAYDNGEIIAYLQSNFLTFERLNISHTNFLGMKDLSVSVAPVQNRIALEHLLSSIRDAAARGKGGGQGTAPVQTDLKWLE